MSSLNVWNNEIQRAMAHPIKRKIIESLRDTNSSFTELSNAVDERNHGKFGYHLRTLKGFIELEPSTKKYRLTHRGRLLDACIRDFRFIASISKELTKYVQHLRLGDHAVGFYDTEYFKRKISFPFLKAGLSKGEAVLYIVSENKLDSEIRELQKYGIDLSSLPNEAFTIMSAYEWYVKKGKAQAKTILANRQELVKQKKEAGFAKHRGAGEMEVFFNYAKVKELLRFEEAVGRQVASNECRLCLYYTRRLDEKQYIRVCNCHGHLISKDIVGKTTV